MQKTMIYDDANSGKCLRQAQACGGGYKHIEMHMADIPASIYAISTFIYVSVPIFHRHITYCG
jgi:hypothetical protein